MGKNKCGNEIIDDLNPCKLVYKIHLSVIGMYICFAGFSFLLLLINRIKMNDDERYVILSLGIVCSLLLVSKIVERTLLFITFKALRLKNFFIYLMSAVLLIFLFITEIFYTLTILNIIIIIIVLIVIWSIIDFAYLTRKFLLHKDEFISGKMDYFNYIDIVYKESIHFDLIVKKQKFEKMFLYNFRTLVICLSIDVTLFLLLALSFNLDITFKKNQIILLFILNGIACLFFIKNYIKILQKKIFYNRFELVLLTLIVFMSILFLGSLGVENPEEYMIILLDYDESLSITIFLIVLSNTIFYAISFNNYIIHQREKTKELLLPIYSNLSNSLESSLLDRPIVNYRLLNSSCRHYYDCLYTILNGINFKTPLVIQITGPRGFGKTSIFNSLKNSLNQADTYFYPYKDKNYNRFFTLGINTTIFDSPKDIIRYLDMFLKSLFTLYTIRKEVMNKYFKFLLTLISEYYSPLKIIDKIANEKFYDNVTMERIKFDFEKDIFCLLKRSGRKAILLFIDDVDRNEEIDKIYKVLNNYFNIEGFSILINNGLQSETNKSNYIDRFVNYHLNVSYQKTIVDKDDYKLIESTMQSLDYAKIDTIYGVEKKFKNNFSLIQLFFEKYNQEIILNLQDEILRIKMRISNESNDAQIEKEAQKLKKNLEEETNFITRFNDLTSNFRELKKLLLHCYYSNMPILQAYFSNSEDDLIKLKKYFEIVEKHYNNESEVLQNFQL